MPGAEKSIRWWRSMRLSRNVEAGGTCRWRLEAKRVRLLPLASTIRFVRAISRTASASSTQSVLRHFLRTGRVATSNVFRSKVCRADQSASPVASFSLLSSRASVLKDIARRTVCRLTRSFSSIVDGCESTGNTLAFASACEHVDRGFQSPMLVSHTPNYQINSPRSLDLHWLPDRSMRKTIQDEKERNVDQRFASGRMPHCDR